MPWKECKPMDERLKFIARLLDGEKMSPLCREFGISRVTGYKIYNRYKEHGLDALYDRSRRPYRHANQLPFQVERTIVNIKREHDSWGAPKIRDKLIRTYPMIKPPAVSTIHAVLDRNGLVKRRKRKRYKAEGTPLQASHVPNGLWCADYKGEFLLGNKTYCYPLTITDYRSRYLIACDGLESTRSDLAFTVFEQVFKEFGLPPSVPIMDFPSLLLTPCSGSAGSPSGGYGSVSRFNASSPGILNKMAAMNVCTEPSRPILPGLLLLTSCNSSRSLMTSCRFTITKGLIRLLVASIQVISIHLPPESISRLMSLSTRSMTAPSGLLDVAEYASENARLTSAPCSLAS